MSCVRPSDMSRLEEVRSDEEESLADAPSTSTVCCGFFCPWFTPQVGPRTPEEQIAAMPRTEQTATFLQGLAEGIRASLSVPINLRRKSHIKPEELTCCLMEPKSETDPCPILQCPACDTLHCHPNYIYHCLLEQPIFPELVKQRRSQPSGQELDVRLPASPVIYTPSDPNLHVPGLQDSESTEVQDSTTQAS